MNTPLKRSGMARVLKGSQFYPHTPRSSANGMNHIPHLPFPSQPKLQVLIYRPRRDGRLSWPGTGTQFHTRTALGNLKSDSLLFVESQWCVDLVWFPRRARDTKLAAVFYTCCGRYIRLSAIPVSTERYSSPVYCEQLGASFAFCRLEISDRPLIILN